MPLTSAQIVALACQEAKCPGFTSQGGQFLNATLQDLCQNYDLDAALGTFIFTFNSVTGQGSGPYQLPADYLRTQVKDGKDEFFYTINGVPYPLIQVTKAEYDWLVQTPGFQSYPYNYATDLSQSPAQLFVWPPASGSYPCVLRYYRLMPDIATPETSATVPWFLNTQILIRDVAGKLMGLTGDSRQAEYLGDDAERYPLGSMTLLNKYLKNVEDREGAVHTVGRDRRRWGRPFDKLKNTKNIGWAIALLFLTCAAFVQPTHAQNGKATMISEVNTNWPDNTTGAITPALLRSTVIDIINSYVDLNGSTSLSCTAHQWMAALPTLSSITCTQPNFTDLAGIASLAQIAATPVTHAVPINIAGTATWGAIPDCGDSAGNHLNYVQASDTFSCGNTGGASGSGGVPLPQGRLTVTSGRPILQAGATAATTLYYAGLTGTQVPYYNGSADALDTIAAGQVLDAMVSAASAGQVVSGQLYDVWWVHGGANRICLAMSASTGGGGGWASDTGGSLTSRGTGYTQLDFTTRTYVTNKNSITNCFNGATNYGAVSANQGTYLGTIYATANGQTSMTLSASGSAGAATILGICNFYNTVKIVATEEDTKANWTYSSTTWHAVDASSLNAISYVDCGAPGGTTTGGTSVTVNYVVAVGGSTSGALIGLNRDSTSATPTFQGYNWAAAGQASVRAVFLPSAGYHTINAVEASYNTRQQTFFGSGWNGGAGQTMFLTLEMQN